MNESNTPPVQPTNFNDLLIKAFRLKEFAVQNGYEVDPKTIQELNALRPLVDQRGLLPLDIPEKWDKLDSVISALTSVTFPTTMDNLSDKPESEQYLRFKWCLFFVGIVALILAIGGFILSVTEGEQRQIYNSILALALGLLGAIVYGLFNVLRIVPPQAFNPRDAYSNYARLLLGALLGWVFYFAFALKDFQNLTKDFNEVTNLDKTAAFMLLAPFIAGYSTKFVVGILNRVIAALEIALGIEDKRDVSARRVSSPRG